MPDANFPSNSKRPAPAPTPEQKNLKSVASGERKKKSLGRQFSETFVGGDLKTTANYVVFDVAIPAVKDLLADATTKGIERLIFGVEGRAHRRPMSPVRPGPTPGRIQYQQFAPSAMPTAASSVPQRQRTKPSPQVGDFDDVILSTRSQAETVLERIGDVLDQYGSVSVADFYSLVGLQSTHTDNSWGWTDLQGSSVTRNRGGGFVLTLPDPSAF